MKREGIVWAAWSLSSIVWPSIVGLPVAFAEDSPSADAIQLRIEGVLLEKGTRKPLSGLNVFVLPSRIKVVTDEQGRFEVPDLPEGNFSWVVNASGYRKLTQEDSQLAREKIEPRVLYLEKESYRIYETTVVGKQKKRDATTQTLKREAFLSAPGAGGDPVKAVQNLPGVNRAASFSSQIVIQGAGPQDTRFSLDGHEIPLVFHFGGLTSVVIPEAVDRVEYLSAGYGPEFGRANGGWVGLWSRSPRNDRTHGVVFADFFNTGGLLEGRLGEDGGYLLSARQSYFGAVLGDVLKDDPDFNLTVAPSYGDVNLVVEKKLTPIDELKWVTIASRDGLEFLFPQPVSGDPAIRGNFRTSTAFFRLIPQLTHTHGPDTLSRWSVGAGRNWISFDTSENYFKLVTDQFSTRNEVEHRFSSEWMGIVGLDAVYSSYRINLKVPTFYGEGGIVNPISVGATRESSVEGTLGVFGLYERNEVRLEGSNLTWMPNARLDYFSQTKEWLLSPRPAVRCELNEGFLLRSAAGLYYQPPEAQQTSANFGNPDVKSPRAWHLTVGAERDFRAGRDQGWMVSGDAFYKLLDRIVIPSTAAKMVDGTLVQENFNNEGRGRVYGFQTQVKYDEQPWSVTLAYTLSRSTRFNPSQAEHVYGFDQTHLLGVIGAVELGSEWRISSRFRYSTGNPKTPVTGGVFDSDNDVYVPLRGMLYSERLSPFLQLDLRVDKKWVFDTWILSLYLDIQNVTNRENPEQINYSYNFAQRETVSGLPILPTFGIKGEF